VRQSVVRLRFEAPVYLDTLSHFCTELWRIAPQAVDPVYRRGNDKDHSKHQELAPAQMIE